MVPKRRSTQLKTSFIAPNTDPESTWWKKNTNSSVLVKRYFPDHGGGYPHTITNHPPLAPAHATHGTLVNDSGDGTVKKARRKSAHRKKY